VPGSSTATFNRYSRRHAFSGPASSHFGCRLRSQPTSFHSLSTNANALTDSSMWALRLFRLIFAFACSGQYIALLQAFSQTHFLQCRLDDQYERFALSQNPNREADQAV
jgi:hypothetical protein